MKMIPIGTPVFYLNCGWGKISNHNSFGIYKLEVTFTLSTEIIKKSCISFTPDGKLLEDDIYPALSLTEYSLESGGFTPISKYWDSIIDKWGYFWDYTHHNTAIFAQLKDIDSDNKFYTSSAKWDNFSIDIPEHIKKLM
jgi:hypothetical protein